jgi:hypothetical protein
MAENKPQRTGASVTAFLNAIADEERRKDCRTVARLMQEVTGEKPAMWGPSIVGFGRYHYRYESGREGDWFLAGFAPRKQDLTLYITAGFDRYAALMKRLGKHKTGRSCLYIKRLSDIDEGVLRDLVAASVRHMRSVNPERLGG